MRAYIVVSLMAGVRPEEARAIGWEEDVDLDGNPPSVAVLRAERAGGGTKTPRSRRARHTFVSLLSDDGMAIEKIARLAGHASSHVTETVYRQELRPVLQEGAEVMDRLGR